MSAVSHEVRGAGRPLIRWTGLAAVVLLLAACGGEGRESASAGTEGEAVTDSAPPASGDTVAAPTADTAAPTATDTSTAGATGDTTARQQARRPAAPAQDTATTAQDTATPPTQTASGQDTAAATGETQTADAPLRDQYHQAPKDTVDQTTYDGWKQYNLNCARCHGEDVLGSTIAPHLVMSLKPDGPINTPELFTQVVCAGRPAKGMPSWCALGMEPAKIGQIYSYVKGRSEGKLSPGRPAVKPEG